MGDLSMPFEADPGGFTLDLPNATVSGGVVVLAAAFEVQGGRKLPALVFRFAHADGSGFLPPVTLVVSNADLTGLVELITQAAEAALEATR